MGGSLGGIFSGSGAGSNGGPSFLQNLVQGTAKGAGTAFGKSMQSPQSPNGNSGVIAAPAPAPVDPRYFMPSNFGPARGAPTLTSGAPDMRSAFYG